MLVDDGVVVVNENSTPTLFLSNAPTTGWSWRSTSRIDSVNRCKLNNGFNAQLATQDLNEACTFSDCEFNVQEISRNGLVEFSVSMPALKAPVALSFILEATLPSGERVEQKQTVCGIAINEAPEITDNFYRALLGELREVAANDEDGVLANDSDDNDVSNEPLFIEEIVTAPRFSDFFTMASDGAIKYEPSAELKFPDEGFINDTFTVSISDGVHSVKSDITIQIVAQNSVPTLRSRVPNFLVQVSESNPVDIEVNLGRYFEDLDGDNLTFRLSNNRFLESGALTFDSSGLLSGLIDRNDIGAETMIITASDGLATASDRFRFFVR